jgi:hypothetical protein
MAGERSEVAGGFVEFRDNPESPFYRADGISAIATWDRSVETMTEVLLELPQLMSDGFQMTPELLCDWHLRIFGELFPDEAGRLR